MNRVVIIMRGPSGFGKSTKAKELADKYNAVVCSADDYFMKDGSYNFDITKLGEAHGRCFKKFEIAIKNGDNVIIDNTNLKPQDVEKYLDHMAEYSGDKDYAIVVYEVSFNNLEKAIEHRTNQEDGKNVPAERIRDMFNLFHKHNLERDIKTYYGKVLKVIKKSEIESYLK
jgi:predicted kinase